MREETCELISSLEELAKKFKKKLDVFEQHRQEFVKNLDRLFDALELMKINEDRTFLERLRELSTWPLSWSGQKSG